MIKRFILFIFKLTFVILIAAAVSIALFVIFFEPQTHKQIKTQELSIEN